VAFVDDHTAAISHDAHVSPHPYPLSASAGSSTFLSLLQGTVFLHVFKKMMGVRMADHTCLLSNKPGSPHALID
jgi:hypothetical protein